MIDNLEEIEKYSPYGGTLILEDVKGTDAKFVTAENSVYTKEGIDRSMYSYVPKSGCPDAKQCQILMVLRDGNDEASARKVMEELKLAELAEEKHFVLLFPNPQDGGWNYRKDPTLDDDMSFLVRCFAALPKSKGGVAGFNGMIFYLGACEDGNALLALLSNEHPVDCSAEMVGKFPADFEMPAEGHFQTAWVYDGNEAFAAYLNKVDAPVEKHGDVFVNKENENLRYFVSAAPLSAEEVRNAWERMFSEARRWRNDTFGHYQKRTNFEEWGFVGHVHDSSLGVNGGFAHTWYEYIPERLRGTKDPIPLVFYFHGGNCIPLYGAEQSDWHVIADQEGFAVVYPRASVNKVWNVWNDATGPSDFDFVMALIEHMDKDVHPIDRSRVYCSGFSMGSMMTNALCCAYPEVFAGGAAFHAQNFGYFKTRRPSFRNIGKEQATDDDGISFTKMLADQKKANTDYRMPLLQGTGLLDGLAGDAWPIKDPENNWLKTIRYWLQYNNIPVNHLTLSDRYETGVEADKTFYDGKDERFIHHVWYSKDEPSLPLYHFLVAKRMPHALDLRAPQISWEFLKHYSRNRDGSLHYEVDVK